MHEVSYIQCVTKDESVISPFYLPSFAAFFFTTFIQTLRFTQSLSSSIEKHKTVNMLPLMYIKQH